MISRTDVEKLAELSLIAVPDSELDDVAKEMGAILEYVADVNKLAGEEGEREKPVLRNVMRDDVVTNTPGEYTKDIVAQFPDKEGDALRVKKIL